MIHRYSGHMTPIPRIKRTVEIPAPIYQRVADFATERSSSINWAFQELLRLGLNSADYVRAYAEHEAASAAQAQAHAARVAEPSSQFSDAA